MGGERRDLRVATERDEIRIRYKKGSSVPLAAEFADWLCQHNPEESKFAFE